MMLKTTLTETNRHGSLQVSDVVVGPTQRRIRLNLPIVRGVSQSTRQHPPPCTANPPLMSATGVRASSASGGSDGRTTIGRRWVLAVIL